MIEEGRREGGGREGGRVHGRNGGRGKRGEGWRVGGMDEVGREGEKEGGNCIKLTYFFGRGDKTSSEYCMTAS